MEIIYAFSVFICLWDCDSISHPYLSVILSKALHSECIKINVSQHHRCMIKNKIPNIVWRERHKWMWKLTMEIAGYKARKKWLLCPQLRNFSKFSSKSLGSAGCQPGQKHINISFEAKSHSVHYGERGEWLVGPGVWSHIEFWSHKWMFQNCRAGGILEVLRGQ